MEVFNNCKEQIRQLIKEEVAKHLGQMQDTIMTSLITFLEHEIREDEISNKHKGTFIDLRIPKEEREEVQLELGLDISSNEVELEDENKIKIDERILENFKNTIIDLN